LSEQMSGGASPTAATEPDGGQSPIRVVSRGDITTDSGTPQVAAGGTSG
jgi:hypothetical protein